MIRGYIQKYAMHKPIKKYSIQGADCQIKNKAKALKNKGQARSFSLVQLINFRKGESVKCHTSKLHMCAAKQ